MEKYSGFNLLDIPALHPQTPAGGIAVKLIYVTYRYSLV
jgi:hypothetical protein